MTRGLDIPTPAWAEPLLLPARYKGAHGGRGSGKSHFFAEALIEAHVLDPDTSSVCVREVQRTLRESVHRLLALKIEELGVGDYFDVQEAVIISKRGSGRIIFQGMQNHTADSIKSLEGYDRAWVEEAQTLSQKSLDLLRPTIRKPHSELWFSWNPSQPDDPIEKLLRSADPPPGAVVVEVNYEDNPWFPDVLRTEMEYDRSRDPEKFAHVWKGGYEAHSEARVFRNWHVEEFETPKNALLRFGADWGFAKDPTVLVRCYLEGRRLYVDQEVWETELDILAIPDAFRQIPDAELYPVIADNKPEIIRHMRKHGFPHMMAAAKGDGSVEAGVKFLQSYEIIVHPRCQHVIDELKSHKRKVDPLTGKVLPVFEDKNNHTIDALRYACEGARRAADAKPNPDSRPPPSAPRFAPRRRA